jgi:hypothetical protein
MSARGAAFIEYGVAQGVGASVEEVLKMGSFPCLIGEWQVEISKALWDSPLSLYEYSGELVDANRGLIEYSGIMRAFTEIGIKHAAGIQGRLEVSQGLVPEPYMDEPAGH